MPEAIFQKGFVELSDRPFLKFSDMIKVAPDLMRLQSYRTVYSFAAKYVKDPLLRRVFSFHPLLVGGNPFQTTSIYALIHHLERQWGVHYVWAARARWSRPWAGCFQEIGRLHPLQLAGKRITVENGRATGVAHANGQELSQPMPWSATPMWPTPIASCCPPRPGKKYTDSNALRDMRYSMSLFVIYFGTTQTVPGHPASHHHPGRALPRTAG